MNKVNFNNYERKAIVETINRQASIELIRIESNYYFISDAQVIDLPKEREK